MYPINKAITYGDGRRFQLIRDNLAVAEFPSGHRTTFKSNRYINDGEDYEEYGKEWTAEGLDSWYSSMDEAMQAYRDAYPNLTEVETP